MADRRPRGIGVLKEVYAGDVVVPLDGAVPLADVTIEQVFTDVWTLTLLRERESAEA